MGRMGSNVLQEYGKYVYTSYRVYEIPKVTWVNLNWPLTVNALRSFSGSVFDHDACSFYRVVMVFFLTLQTNTYALYGNSEIRDTRCPA